MIIDDEVEETSLSAWSCLQSETQGAGSYEGFIVSFRQPCEDDNAEFIFDCYCFNRGGVIVLTYSKPTFTGLLVVRELSLREG